jgi:hypothetical protein
LAVLVRLTQAETVKLAPAPVAHQETTVFPFTGYVSISKDGPPGDEDLVLTWSVQRHNGRLLITADVARGDGTVLAETSAAELAEPANRSEVIEEQERAMRFFRRNLDLIKQEVC